MQGQYDPTYEDIIKAVSSIIFLSTPHRGTNLAETLNRILQVSFSTSPMQFIAELSAGSQTLQKLNEQFRHVAPKLQIVSFYETRPTTVIKKTQIVGLAAHKPISQLFCGILTVWLLIDGSGERLVGSRISGRGIKAARRGPPRGLQIREPG